MPSVRPYESLNYCLEPSKLSCLEEDIALEDHFEWDTPDVIQPKLDTAATQPRWSSSSSSSSSLSASPTMQRSLSGASSSSHATSSYGLTGTVASLAYLQGLDAGTLEAWLMTERTKLNTYKFRISSVEDLLSSYQVMPFHHILPGIRDLDSPEQSSLSGLSTDELASELHRVQSTLNNYDWRGVWAHMVKVILDQVPKDVARQFIQIWDLEQKYEDELGSSPDASPYMLSPHEGSSSYIGAQAGSMSDNQLVGYEVGHCGQSFDDVSDLAAAASAMEGLEFMDADAFSLSGDASLGRTSSTKMQREFPCPEKECKAKPFARSADLVRHMDMLHKDENQKPKYRCDYRRCGRSDTAFNRMDHYRDHFREYHREDILKRGGFDGKKDKDGGRRKHPGPEEIKKREEEWWEARVITPLSWRCTRCLHKMTFEGDRYDAQKADASDYWICAGCTVACEPRRRTIRESMAFVLNYVWTCSCGYHNLVSEAGRHCQNLECHAKERSLEVKRVLASVEPPVSVLLKKMQAKCVSCQQNGAHINGEIAANVVKVLDHGTRCETCRLAPTYSWDATSFST